MLETHLAQRAVAEAELEQPSPASVFTVPARGSTRRSALPSLSAT
jgi:hypothetical protein